MKEEKKETKEMRKQRNKDTGHKKEKTNDYKNTVSMTMSTMEGLGSLDLMIFPAEVVAGSAAWLGKGLSCVCVQSSEGDARPSFDLTPVQEALRALWDAAFPREELCGLVSKQVCRLSLSGCRGGGFMSLENLYLGRNFPRSFQDLLLKQDRDRAMWEYPFAVAGVNITFMLIQMLDLEAVKPRTMLGATFLKFLAGGDESYSSSAGNRASAGRRKTA
ncbi:hypothetical protein RHMOL_Rhmol07G0045100 [Rhododendron molle]|uniref:Uncharacterized protein n=1 Tax=Rhododendron molle TaxID=49168 RepID=A0ACC0MXM5_RHOML|nr:hypothetical protein RHMOL_Rhmol07G0045100 [Rhododendron molle]